MLRPRTPSSIAAAVLASLVALTASARAQNLSFALFERYLESFRVEAQIPGLSAALVRHGIVIWERGFGRRDLEANLPATPDTPYAIGDLSHIFGATLLLKKCVDEGSARLTDPMASWIPLYPEPTTTIEHLLAHAGSGGTGFAYDPRRFAAITGVIEQCIDLPYRLLLAQEIFDRLGMVDSAPDGFLASPDPLDNRLFDSAHLTRYAAVLQRMAVPYLVTGGRAQRNPDLRPTPLDAATGIVTSVRDLARLDAAFAGNVLLTRATRDQSWSPVTAGFRTLPTGLGWFVQEYQGEPVVWQFGLIRGGYSSLIVKAPNRGMTLILLANSDTLNATARLDQGDLNASLFGRLFLRFFIP